MPALFVFLLKVNIALIIFCLGYYFVLRRLTFYTLNRVYLGIAIIFSSLYPFISLDSFLQRHQQLAVPVQNVVIDWKAPEQFIQQPGYWFWATVIFWLGVALFAGRLLMQLFSLYKLYKNSKPGTVQGHDVRLVKADISPFSFWQSIYINPASLNPEDLEGILQHEQIHVTEWHTMDILLAEISVVFYWFNPGVWLMKKAVRENIEFITDRKILQRGMDSKAYQYSLLNVSFNASTSAGIANHFNFSTLKKRITMMNAKRSSTINLTRYAFLIPVVLISLFTISLTKAELVKHGKMAYKSIKTSVNSLATTVNITPEIAIKKHVLLKWADTDKKANSITIVSTRSIDGDTSKKHEFKVVKNNDSTSYYVDGKKVNADEVKMLSANDIQRINVINYGTSRKDSKAYIYTKGDPNIVTVNNIRINNNVAVDTTPVTIPNYHVYKTEHGKPIIISGKNIDNSSKTYTISRSDGGVGNTQVIVNGIKPDDNKKINRLVIRGNNIQADATRSIFIVDGKEISPQDMHELNPDDIEVVNVIGSNNKDLIEKYGDKAKNGAIVVTMKKTKQKQ